MKRGVINIHGSTNPEAELQYFERMDSLEDFVLDRCPWVYDEYDKCSEGLADLEEFMEMYYPELLEEFENL